MSYWGTGRGSGPPTDGSKNDSGYSVPQQGSGGYSVPQHGIVGYSIPQQNYPYGYGYGQYGNYSTPGTQGPPPPTFPVVNIPPQSIPPPHTYYGANFGDNSAAAEHLMSPVNQNIDSRQQTHHHSKETHTRTNDRKLPVPSEESQRRTEKSYSKSKSSESRRAHGAGTDSSVDRGSYRDKSSGYSREPDKSKSRRKNSDSSLNVDRPKKSDFTMEDLLQDERLKSVLFAGISKATAKLERSLKSPEGETSESVALADDSSRKPGSQQVRRASSSSIDSHRKPKSILKQNIEAERVDVEGEAVSGAFSKLSALEKTLHLLRGKTNVLVSSGGLEKSVQDRQKQSVAAKSALGQLASYSDSGDESTDKTNKFKKPSQAQPFWSVGAIPAVTEKAEKETESFDVQEKLSGQWKQSSNRTPEGQRTPTKEKEMSQVDPFFQKKIRTHASAAASKALKKADNNDSEELDSTVQNILQSIGFNFDLSKRMQELARQKKKHHDTLSPGEISQSAAYLGKSEGLAQDVRAALFSDNQKQGTIENLIKEARASTRKSRWGDEEKNYGRRGRSPEPIVDKRGADVHREKKRSDLQPRDVKHEKTLEKSFKNEGWKEISLEKDDWAEREAREITDKIIKLSYERGPEIRQQPFSRETDAASPPHSSLDDENWQSKKNVPSRHGERSHLISERIGNKPKGEYIYPDDEKYTESSKAVSLLTQFSSKRKEDLSSGLIPSLKLPSQSGSKRVENLRVTSRAIYDAIDEAFAESRRVILSSESDQRIVSRSPVYRGSRSPVYKTSQSPERIFRKRSASPLTPPVSKERRLCGGRGDHSPIFSERGSPITHQSFDHHAAFSKVSDSGMRLPERLRSPIMDDYSGRERRKSPNRRKSRSPSDHSRSRSPGRQRSRSPGRQRSRSPGRQKSRSPDRQRSRSPGRQRSRSPGRQRSRSPGRQRSRSPGRQRSRSPGRQRSRSPGRQRSRSPGRQRSRSPGRQRSRSPGRQRSRSPGRQRSRSPGRQRSRSPGRQRSRSLSGHRSRSPRKQRSSGRQRSISPRRQRSSGRQRSRSPRRQKSRSPSRLRSRSPGRQRSRSPSRQRSRSPSRQRSRSRGRFRSRSPGWQRSRSPIRPRSRSRSLVRHRSPIRRQFQGWVRGRPSNNQRSPGMQRPLGQRQNSNRDKNHKASGEIKPDTGKPKLDHKDKLLEHAKVDMSKFVPEEMKAYLQKLLEEKGQTVDQAKIDAESAIERLADFPVEERRIILTKMTEMTTEVGHTFLQNLLLRQARASALKLEVEKLRKERNNMMRKYRRGSMEANKSLLLKNLEAREKLQKEIERLLTSELDVPIDQCTSPPPPLNTSKDPLKKDVRDEKAPLKKQTVSRVPKATSKVKVPPQSKKVTVKPLPSSRQVKQDSQINSLSDSSSKQKVYNNSENHQCKYCSCTCKTLKDLFQHYRGRRHLSNIEVEKRPWKDENMKSAAYEMGTFEPHSIKGIDTIFPVVGFYCSLCKVFCGDFTETNDFTEITDHMMSGKHYVKYMEFHKQNLAKKTLLVKKTPPPPQLPVKETLPPPQPEENKFSVEKTDDVVKPFKTRSVRKNLRLTGKNSDSDSDNGSKDNNIAAMDIGNGEEAMNEDSAHIKIPKLTKPPTVFPAWTPLTAGGSRSEVEMKETQEDDNQPLDQFLTIQKESSEVKQAHLPVVVAPDLSYIPMPEVEDLPSEPDMICTVKSFQQVMEEEKKNIDEEKKMIGIDVDAEVEKPMIITPVPPPSLINTVPSYTSQGESEDDSKKKAHTTTDSVGQVVLEQKLEDQIKALANENVNLKEKQEGQREQKSEEEETGEKRFESGSLSFDKSDELSAISCNNQEATENLSGNAVSNQLETTDLKQVDLSLTSVEYDDQQVMASERSNIVTSTVVEETAQVEKTDHGQNDLKEVEARPDVEVATPEAVLKEVLPLKVEDLVTVTEGKSVSNVNLEIGDSAYFADSHAVGDQEDKSAGEGMLRKMAASAKSECEVLDNELVVLSGVAEDSQGENYTGHVQDSAGSSEKNTAAVSTMEKVQQHEVMSETTDELSSSGSNREYELQEVSSSNPAEVESCINDCITVGASQAKMNITSPEDDSGEQMDTDDIVVVGQGISITTSVDGIQKETSITDLVTVIQEEGNITHPEDDSGEQKDTDDIVVVGQGISITTPVDGIQKETNITDLVTVSQEEGNITHPEDDSGEQKDTDDIVVVGQGISITTPVDGIQKETNITDLVTVIQEEGNITHPDNMEQMDTDNIVVVGQGISITTPVDGIQKETNITDLVTVIQEEGNITHPDNMEQMDTDNIVVVGQGISITTPVDGIQKETNITDLVTVIQEEGNITHPDSREQMDTDDIVVVGQGISIAESIDSIQGGTIITGPVTDSHEENKIASPADDSEGKVVVACPADGSQESVSTENGVGIGPRESVTKTLDGSQEVNITVPVDDSMEALSMAITVDDNKEQVSITENKKDSKGEKNVADNVDGCEEEICIADNVDGSKEKKNITDIVDNSNVDISTDVAADDCKEEIFIADAVDSKEEISIIDAVDDSKEITIVDNDITEDTNIARSADNRKALVEKDIIGEVEAQNVGESTGQIKESSDVDEKDVYSDQHEVPEITTANRGRKSTRSNRGRKKAAEIEVKMDGGSLNVNQEGGSESSLHIAENVDSGESEGIAEVSVTSAGSLLNKPSRKPKGETASSNQFRGRVTRSRAKKGQADPQTSDADIEKTDVEDTEGDRMEAGHQDADSCMSLPASETETVGESGLIQSGQEQELVDDNRQQSGNDIAPQQHCHGHTGGQSRDPPMSGVIEDEEESTNTIMVSVAETDSQVIEPTF